MKKMLIGMLLLAGCQNVPQSYQAFQLYQPLGSAMSQCDLFNVSLPRVDLTNATMDVALRVVQDAWAHTPQIKDPPPLVGWMHPTNHAPNGERLITLRARDISVGDYLVLLSNLSNSHLTFQSGAIVIDEIPPWIQDIYETTFVTLQPRAATLLDVSDTTTPDDIRKTLEGYGVNLQIRFWDAKQRWMIVTGFPEDQIAFAGLRRLAEKGIKVTKLPQPPADASAGGGAQKP